MGQIGGSGLVERMIGAARLDPATYEEVEHDAGANRSALLVVLLGAIASGLVGLGTGGAVGFLGGILAAILGWIFYAAVAYYIGTRILRTSETRATIGELLRTLGYAQSPQLLLVLGVVPGIGTILGVVVSIWMVATTVVAVRQALDYTSTARAIVTALVAWIIYGIVYGTIAALLFL